MWRRPDQSRRPGITLVELVAVMAAGAVLVSVAIAVFVAVIRNDRRFSDRFDAQQSLSELANRLRRDVHAAVDGAWDEATATLRLETAGGGRVEYAFKHARCERREAGADDEEGRLAGAYRLPSRTECSVSFADLADHTLVRVGLAAPKPGARRDAPRQHTEVVAVVGRDSDLLYP